MGPGLINSGIDPRTMRASLMHNGLLDGQPKMSPVGPAGPMPAISASLMTRLRYDPLGLLKSIGGGLRDGLVPGNPELEGLLSPDQIKSARSRGLLDFGLGMLNASRSAPGTGAPSFGQALSAGVQAGRAGYDEATQGALQMGQMTQQIEQHRKMIGARAQIQQQFALGPNDPPDMVEDKMRKMFAAFVNAGDTEMIAKLNSVAPALFQNQKGQEPKWEDFGGYKGLMSPDGRELQRVMKTPSPKDPNAPDTAALNREQKLFDRTNRLADDYRSESKEIAKAADGFRTMMSNTAPARAGNPAAQIALIYGFMHTQDPASTVREGEYATAQNAAGVPERVRNIYNKALDGAFLTPEQVDNFVGTARNSAQSWQQRQSNLHETYKQRAGRWKINADDVVLDYFQGIDMSGAGGDKDRKVTADRVRAKIGGKK